MNSKFYLTCWLACVLASVQYAHAGAADKKFERILDDHWQYSLQESPFTASSEGDKRYNRQLPKTSLADLTRRAEQSKKFLQRLNKIKVKKLSASNQLNLQLLKQDLEYQVKRHDVKYDLINLTNRGGIHLDYLYSMNRLALFTEHDYRDYIERIRAFPEYLSGHVEVMREAIKHGFTHACESMQGYETSISAHIVDAASDSSLYQPFNSLPDRLSEDTRSRLKAEAQSAISDQFIPPLKQLYQVYTEEYHPACQQNPGIRHWQNGDEIYKSRVAQFTTTDLTAQEIHDLGLSEVKRINGEMQQAVKDANFHGNVQEFIDYLRTDPRFYPKTPEELVSVVSTISKKMDGFMPQLFGKLPRQPYGIEEVPADIAEKTTIAYYAPGASDGTRAGFYFINTSKLESRPLYTMEALTLHEAVPGHHLQIALSLESEIPDFRRQVNYTVFIEGWGLYAERLGLEVGFYQDPYSNFGRLSYEMWRALRLVVDTGIHSLGWSRQQAIDFMAENSALSLHNITSEVDRYITWPGQALAYKIGELKIRELRAKAEQELKEDFDLRAFHDEILSHGAVPLSVLETLVNQWINDSQSS